METVNISGNEITGAADPTVMFYVVGVIICIGFIGCVAYAIYKLIG